MGRPIKQSVILNSYLEWLLAGEMNAHLLLTVTILFIIRLYPALCAVNLGTCILQGDPQPASLFEDGDFVIGGAFTIHYYVRTEKPTYTRRPQPPECSGRLEFDLKIIK